MVNVTRKVRIATVSLAGCFGCHMSFLDIDEALVGLADKVEFDRSPFTDIKTVKDCDVGLVEGGVCNAENVEVLREFREQCKVLVSMGACAINGGVPALRNRFSLEDCLTTAYVDAPGIKNPMIPNDEELPLLLDQVHPIHEVVSVDYFLPGCPPSAAMISQFLDQLLNGETPDFEHNLIHYD